MHLIFLKCLYNYGFVQVIDFTWRQLSDTGSSNYLLGDRILLFQLHSVNIFCHDVSES